MQERGRWLARPQRIQGILAYHTAKDLADFYPPCAKLKQ